MIILQTKNFAKQKKKLLTKQIDELDRAVTEIKMRPDLGELKKGELQGIRVYKFIRLKQKYLLAYTAMDSQITLLNLGPHENFYRDLKRTL